jgi:uncharacterized membrane protein YoaK (UPF0700 family)
VELTIPRSITLTLVSLTLAAGLADAVGYLTMGGVFAANMTGNTVLAAIAVARHDYLRASHCIEPLISFFLGAMLSRLLLRLTGRPIAGLAVEAVLIAGVGFLPVGPEPKVIIVAVAMGVQTSAITHFAGSAISTVVVTTTLARTADALLDRLWPTKPTAPLPVIANPGLLAITWLSYFAGAVVGALLAPIVAWPLLVPAALLVLLLLL